MKSPLLLTSRVTQGAHAAVRFIICTTDFFCFSSLFTMLGANAAGFRDTVALANGVEFALLVLTTVCNT